MVFHLSVFSSFSANWNFGRRPWSIGCKDMIFHLSVFLSVSSNSQFQRRPLDTDYKDMPFHSKCFFQIIIVRENFKTLLTRICFIKWPLSEKALGHWLQWYGFSPECVLIWFFNLMFWEKALKHLLQGHGFSSEYFFKHHFERKTYDIDCNNIILHLSAFLSASSNWYLLRKPWDIDYKDMFFAWVCS